MTPHVAFTVGYQGSDPDIFVADLQAAGVAIVIDTRLHPMSRRPAFRREALRTRLAAGGIAYRWQPTLGTPKRIRPLATRRPWLFRAGYRGVLGRAGSDVEEVAAIARSATIALLCFELDERECHRSLLAAELARRAPLHFVHLRPGRV